MPGTYKRFVIIRDLNPKYYDFNVVVIVRLPKNINCSNIWFEFCTLWGAVSLARLLGFFCLKMAFSAVKTRFLQQLSSGRSVFPYFSFAGFFVELHEKTLQIRYSFSWLLKMDMATLSAKVFKHHKKTDGTFTKSKIVGWSC